MKEKPVKLNTLKWNTLYIKRHYKMSETISHKLREDIFTQNTGERIVFIILKIASTKFIACNKEVMNQ